MANREVRHAWSPKADSAVTWRGNSQTNRLTPWHNDPVSDPQSEVIYLRDDESGAVLDAHAAARFARMMLTARATAKATRSSSTTATPSGRS